MKDLDHLFSLACEDWDRGLLKEAYSKFKLGAEKGHPSSQNNLGVFYECGYYVESNYELAIFWYSKAASGDEIASLSNLGDLFLKMGRVEDAITWYVKSSSFDDGDALYELAKIYLLDGFSGKDEKRAISYLQEALKSNSITPNSLDNAKHTLDALISNHK
ncbi:tetratricopeptide repeat protein [Agaribacterium sp. ZY112]|uniref:tetratricopeptide repeat protein n=1 Tax=Agaribacterium sp. ZY112 TaxID=3233574 RepID=UPI0035240E6D